MIILLVWFGGFCVGAAVYGFCMALLQSRSQIKKPVFIPVKEQKVEFGHTIEGVAGMNLPAGVLVGAGAKFPPIDPNEECAPHPPVYNFEYGKSPLADSLETLRELKDYEEGILRYAKANDIDVVYDGPLPGVGEPYPVFEIPVREVKAVRPCVKTYDASNAIQSFFENADKPLPKPTVVMESELDIVFRIAEEKFKRKFTNAELNETGFVWRVW